LEKKVLVLYYSQTGQLRDILDSILGGAKDDNISVTTKALLPKKHFPYPWNFFSFFDIFPECVYMEGCEIEPVGLENDFDLIILGYQPWFLSPSLPVSGFLKSKEAGILLANKPVITVIGCRNMWIMAQEKLKKALGNINAKLIDNIVLIDQGSSMSTFFTTVRWMFTGKKNECCGVFPKAGVADEEIKNAVRFGKAIKYALLNNEEKKQESILEGLKAVTVDKKLVKSEEIAHRNFLIWGKLIKTVSAPDSFPRKILLIAYVSFLFTLIITVVPFNMLIQSLLAKLRLNKNIDKKTYYEAPSGSRDFRLKDFS
jgi:hypothetical protein